MEKYRPEQRHLSAVTTTDLEKVDQLQQRWNQKLGVQDARPGEFGNYNPVLARWNFERLKTDDQVNLFRQNELQNITTALRERNQTQESRLVLMIDQDKKIRNDAFPDEPYENMLERGRVYRAENGSQDLVREQAEINGFKTIQEVLSSEETPVGSTFMVISPPSSVKDSPYSHNFIDGYQAAIDPITNKRVINYVRFSSPLDYAAYAGVATGFDESFFERKAQAEDQFGDEIPLDAWYLGNPLFVPSEKGYKDIDSLFADKFAPDIKAMEEDEWKKLDAIYLPYKLYLIDQLTKPDFDPVAIAEAYNTMLLSAENEHMQIKDDEHVIYEANSNKLNQDTTNQIAAFVRAHGQDEVQEVKAGCGNSGGIKIKTGYAALLNSVSQFGGEQEWFSCPECPFKATGPIGNGGCPGCGLTKEMYAEKSGVNCA